MIINRLRKISQSTATTVPFWVLSIASLAATDIYTVSKLLTHKNVTTTQIYADLVSSVKREAVNRLSLKKKKSH